MPGPPRGAASSTASAQGSATRLLVLGCVRIFQPVHGYFLRRELLSWEVDGWAHVHPGSIYNALKSLTRAGLLEERDPVPGSTRPQRTTYVLSPTGETEFFALVRAGLLDTADVPLLLTAINMAYVLPRDEVIATIETRIGLLEAIARHNDEMVEQMLAAVETPDTASEVSRLMGAHTRGELDWAHGYLHRVRSGAYSFAGEPPTWGPTPEQREIARLAGVGPGVLLVEAEWEREGDGKTRNSQG